MLDWLPQTILLVGTDLISKHEEDTEILQHGTLGNHFEMQHAAHSYTRLLVVGMG